MDNKIKAERERLGLTQMELASRSGVHLSLISRIERGGGCNQETAQKLARALSSTVEDLFPLDEAA